MVDKIYIVHFEKLKERKKYIDRVLLHPFFLGKTKLINSDENKDKSILLKNNSFYDKRWSQGLKKIEIIHAEQMFSIYEDIKKEGFINSLILEDDFILSNNFDNYIGLFDSLPSDFDCVFMSSCSGLKVSNNFNGRFYESEMSRCTCAYIVSLNFCKKITINRRYFSPIDWHLNFIKKELGLKYYWTKDIIFEQGSETVYKSNVR